MSRYPASVFNCCNSILNNSSPVNRMLLAIVNEASSRLAWSATRRAPRRPSRLEMHSWFSPTGSIARFTGQSARSMACRSHWKTYFQQQTSGRSKTRWPTKQSNVCDTQANCILLESGGFIWHKKGSSPSWAQLASNDVQIEYYCYCYCARLVH